MREIKPSHKQHVGILPNDVSRVPKLYKSCLPCRSSTNPHRRCPRVRSPVSSPSVYTIDIGAHRGAKCAWIHNSMGPIFNINNDFVAALIRRLGCLKVLRQRGRGALHQHVPCAADQIYKINLVRQLSVRAIRLTTGSAAWKFCLACLGIQWRERT